MKILVISHACVTDVNQQLFVCLQQHGETRVELVLPARWRSEYTGREFKPRLLSGVNFPVHYLPVAAAGHVSLHFYRRGLRMAVRDARPDLVFLDEEPWSLAAVQTAQICRRLRVPFVCYTKQNIRKRYPPPFSWIEQNTYRSARAIIALSEEVREVLRAKGYAGPCPLLAHACDLSLFYPGASDQRRKALGLHGTVIGYMGRFVKEKGLDTLVRAVVRICRQQPGADCTVLMVGAGPEEDSLRRLIAENGLEPRFVFAGAVPHAEAGEYMRCMDLFVLPSLTTPSWKEQFGRVIVEALACAVPVVGSSSGQIPYLIRDTGGGSVFAEGDDAELAGALLALINDPAARKRLAGEGARSVRDCYAYPAIACRLQGILQDARVKPFEVR